MSNDPSDRRQPIDDKAWRERQRSRNRVLGLILGGLALLFFAITIAKLGIAGDVG